MDNTARSSCGQGLRAFVFALAIVLPEQGQVAVHESKHTKFCVDTVLSGLAYPVALVFLSANQALVAERPGRLSRWDLQTGNITSVVGVPTTSGLLRVVADPEFQTNGWLYLSYARRQQGSVFFNVARARLEANSLARIATLFTSRPRAQGRVLYGGALLFLPDRTFLVSVGSDQLTGSAQVLASHLGTVVRLKSDGTVPPDNPFVHDRNRLPEIFTYGHRNIQGLAIDLETGFLWATEHGPEGADELNVLSVGNNYGWPIVSSGMRSEAKAGSTATELTNPVVIWQETLAPTGLLVYRQSQFPQWHGDLFIGSLVQRRLERVRLANGSVTEKEPLLVELGERIREVVSDQTGNIYVLTDSIDGRIIRLAPCSPSPSPE